MITVGVLIVVFVVWLILGIVRQEFAQTGFWFTLFLILAILLYFGAPVLLK
jgi:nitrate/nitrite transporter NarK